MQEQVDPCKLLRFAYFCVILWMLYLFAVTFIPIPETGEDNAKYITGFLVGSGLVTIIAFYFRRGHNPDQLDGNGSAKPVEGIPEGK